MVLTTSAALLTCGDAISAEPQQSLTIETIPAQAVASALVGAADSTSVLGTVQLPINQSFAGAGPVFRIHHEGTGTNAHFIGENRSNSAPTLFAQSNGAGDAIRGTMVGSGRAGVFAVMNSSNANRALEVTTTGVGEAARFAVNSAFHGGSAVVVTSNRISGNALRVLGANESGGSTAYFEQGAIDNVGANAVEAYVRHTGAAGVFRVDGGSNNIRGAVEATSNSDGPAGVFRQVRSSVGLAIDASTVGFNSAGLFTVAQQNSAAGALEAKTNSDVGWAGVFSTSGAGGGVRITTNGGPGLQVTGGTKNAVVHTSTGARALYTEESAEVWFTDYAFGRLTRGRARVVIDPIFAETVNLAEPYHVFVQSYGDAELIVANRTATSFDILLREGKERDVEFSYRLVARRSGFEKERLRRAPWAERQ